MGSLMAGWDSPVRDENKVLARRNRSLTKEEVEAFWKQRRRKVDDDGEVVASPLGSPGTESPVGSLEKGDARSPLAGGGIKVSVEAFPGGEEDGESPSKSRDWWTRSSWAFLNEPPQEAAAGRAQRYTPQFAVARIATAGDA